MPNLYLQRAFTALLTLCLLTTTVAGKTKKVQNALFAKTVVKNDAKIYRGDSSVVTVYAYSLMPFGSVQTPAKAPKLKGCHVRRLPQRGQRQSITYLDGRPYYTVVCGQYMVGSSKNGKYKFPKVKVNAVVMEEKEEDRNRRDPFFGPFSDFFRQPEYNPINQSATSPATPFEVVSPPRKSSEQLRHEGKMLI